MKNDSLPRVVDTAGADTGGVDREQQPDKYDAYLDAELARADEPASAELERARDRAHAGGMASYLKLHARSTLPFAILVGLVRGGQGGSLAAVVGSILGVTVVGGLVSFAVRSLGANKRSADEQSSTADADERAARAGTTERHGDDHYDAQLDEEIEKLDEGE